MTRDKNQDKTFNVLRFCVDILPILTTLAILLAAFVVYRLSA